MDDRPICDAFDYGKLQKQTRFPIICVYDHPTDYPDYFVARVWDLNRPTRLIALADTLEGIRAKIPPGMVMLRRHPTDDPCIKEIWM